jgi:hypothetical protein
MARYTVQRFHNAQRLGRTIEIEAASELNAAEGVFGEPLVDGALDGRLAAEVYPSENPSEKRLFSRAPRRAAVVASAVASGAK